MTGITKRKHTNSNTEIEAWGKRRKEERHAARSNLQNKNMPVLKLSKAGKEAELTMHPTLRRPLLLSDVRSQLHWACLRSYYDPYSLDWCSLTRKPSQTTVIIVEGVSMAVLERLSLRHKKVMACYHKLQQQQRCHKADEGESDVGWKTSACQNRGCTHSTQLPADDAPNNSLMPHGDGCEANETQRPPETSVSATVQAFLPSCWRHLDVRLELVGPGEGQHNALQELLLLRCPSATAASIKAGNRIPPRSLVHVPPATCSPQPHRSTEPQWPPLGSARPSALLLPPHERLIRAWGVRHTTHQLHAPAKWTKRKKGSRASTAQPDRFDRREMLLSLEQLVSMKFPLPPCVADFVQPVPSCFSDAFVATKDVYAEVTAASAMFGVDCEFVRVEGGGLALGSIAVVSECDEVVYRSLVLPDEPVVDYLTQWSGLTAEMLAPVTTRLSDVHAKIRKYLPADAILVGHSLQNDLRTMQMHHPYVVDTSVLYNLSGCKSPSKLKTLSSHFLHRDIQRCSSLGHDPAEDASAALQLALLKLQHDMTFGNARLGSRADATLAEHNLFYNMFEHLEEWQRMHSSSPPRPLQERLLLLTTPPLALPFTAALSGLEAGAALRVLPSNGETVDAACSAAMLCDICVLWLEADARLQSKKTKTRVAALRELDSAVERVLLASPVGALVAVVLAGTPDPAPSNGIYMAGIRTL